MGRGRAKAKQTRVARDLKYSTPNTDLASLQRELSGHSGDSNGAAPEFEATNNDGVGAEHDSADVDDWYARSGSDPDSDQDRDQDRWASAR